MQTFLPLPDFRESLEKLDRQRLGKQRVEAYQILLSLTVENYGWRHHPAVKIWKGYERALVLYGLVCCDVWSRRGYEDTTAEKIRTVLPLDPLAEIVMPPWFGDERLHSSHRANLLRKDSVFYGRYGWSESPDLPYFWPI